MPNQGTYRLSLLFLAVVLGFATACTSSGSPSQHSPTPTSSIVFTGGPVQTSTPITPPTTDGSSVPPTVPQLPNVAAVVARVGPSVVSLLVERGSGFASGSGVIFDAEGHILTNNHVIQDADRVTVTLDDGHQYDARVIGTDRLTDLAVLKIESVVYPDVSFADPGSVQVGQWVIAIGNALALPGGPSVTVGVVSAVDRSFQAQRGQILNGLIQTDAVINPGNSGGPLLNLSGEVVGINTAVLRGERIEGIGFAVSAETAIPVSQELIDYGRVRWAWLGVVASDLSLQEAAERNLAPDMGVLLIDVAENGPAWEAGLRADDVLLTISGNGVVTVKDLTRILRYDFRAGDPVEVDIWRDGQQHTLQVILGERPT